MYPKRNTLALVTEIQEAQSTLEELIENYEFLKSKERQNSKHETCHLIFQACPRCKFVSRTELTIPYCPDCNWDQITDLFEKKYIAELAA